MARGAAQIEQTAFGQYQDRVTVREGPFVILCLDIGLDDAVDLGNARHVDFIVEVTDVADDGAIFHVLHVI